MGARFTILFVLAVACAAPVTETRVALPAPPTPAQPDTLAIPAELPAAYASAWTWWEAGEREDALRAFRYVVEELVAKGDPDPRRRSRRPLEVVVEPDGPIVSDGSRTLTLTETGVLLGDANRRAFEHFVPTATPYEASLVATGLAAIIGLGEVVLLDVAKGAVVARLAMESGAVLRGKNRFITYGVSSGFEVVVWDAASRERVQSLRDPSLGFASSVRFADDERVVSASGEHVDLWDVASGEAFLTYKAPPVVANVPAISADGRFVAYGTIDFDKTPPLGTTFLYDRKTKRVVATSHVSSFPSGFAFFGKWLAVGDLRSACLLAVPRMTRVACSAEVRPHYGVDDDLQETTPTFVAGGSALALETGDGSMLIARVPSMQTLWKGRARLEGARLVDADGSGASWTLGNDGTPVRDPPRAASDEPATRIPACRVGSWVFPPAACSRPG